MPPLTRLFASLVIAGCGELSAPTPLDGPGPEDATLVVDNASSHPVVYLYVAGCADAAWGVDQLGANVMSPGGRMQLTGIEPGCYKFRAESWPGTVYWEHLAPTYLEAGQVYTWTLYDASPGVAGATALVGGS